MSVTKTVSKLGSVALFLGLVLTGCASQQEDTGDIISNTDNGTEDGGEPASGSGEENDDNGGGEEGSGEGGEEGGNGASAEGGEEGATEGGGEEAPAVDAPAEGGTDAAAASTAPPAEAPAAAGATPPPAGAGATAGAAGAAAGPVSEQAPIEGGRVRYVKEGGAKVTSQAGGGDVVRTLEQGEHPVTWDEGAAYKIGTGMYVPKEAMSDKGIPRAGFVKPN